VLKGTTTGSGRVGGGLKNRGIVYVPNVHENSQETGRVVIEICVDKNGSVISSNYTQRGSTTQSKSLKEKAESAAKKYKFTPGEIDEQCGQVTFDFKVQ
jgi:TonB family protein